MSNNGGHDITHLSLSHFYLRPLYEWFICRSVPSSVRPSVTTFSQFQSSYHHEICRSHYHWRKWCPCKRESNVKVIEIKTEFSRFRRVPPVRIHDEMVHKAWCGIGEVPFCFWMPSVKFQGYSGQKVPTLTRIERFRTVTPVWIPWWCWYNGQSLMRPRKGDLLFFEYIHLTSKSYELWNQLFESNLSKLTWPPAAIKYLRFALIESKDVWV